MAYQSLTLSLLISAPGDIPDEDLVVIRRTINQWNVSIGRAFAVTVLPISWTEHGVSQFGDRPQATINHQLVDNADLALALFNRRLGTPTGTAESGTAEEIAEMTQAGKPVSILRNQCPQPPISGDAVAEHLRLEEFLRDEIFARSLVLGYRNHAELVQHINNLLSFHTSAFRQRVDDALSPAVSSESAGVWPRIEIQESTTLDRSGTSRSARNWMLVLENTTGRPVHDVTYEFAEQDQIFDLGRGSSEKIGTLAPHGAAKFPLYLSMQSAPQADCIVTWHDSSGRQYQTIATVRT